jgi:hypothetical protein
MASDTSPVSTAGCRLVGVPELLEQILLKLPMKDLLMSQKVCRTWMWLIHGSLPLCRALFLAPAAYPNISYLDWRYVLQS